MSLFESRDCDRDSRLGLSARQQAGQGCWDNAMLIHRACTTVANDGRHLVMTAWSVQRVRERGRGVGGRELHAISVHCVSSKTACLMFVWRHLSLRDNKRCEAWLNILYISIDNAIDWSCERFVTISLLLYYYICVCCCNSLQLHLAIASARSMGSLRYVLRNLEKPLRRFFLLPDGPRK